MRKKFRVSLGGIDRQITLAQLFTMVDFVRFFASNEMNAAAKLSLCRALFHMPFLPSFSWVCYIMGVNPAFTI